MLGTSALGGSRDQFRNAEDGAGTKPVAEGGGEAHGTRETLPRPRRREERPQLEKSGVMSGLHRMEGRSSPQRFSFKK